MSPALAYRIEVKLANEKFSLQGGLKERLDPAIIADQHQKNRGINPLLYPTTT